LMPMISLLCPVAFIAAPYGFFSFSTIASEAPSTAGNNAPTARCTSVPTTTVSSFYRSNNICSGTRNSYRNFTAARSNSATGSEGAIFSGPN
jgi:hypothetical protein